MTSQEVLDEFGCDVMRMVRDRSIERFEKIQLGQLRSKRAVELHGLFLLFDEAQKSAVKELVFESIDSAIFNFLFMFEENEGRRLMVADVDVSAVSDGLSGELFTDDGWISRYSQKK